MVDHTYTFANKITACFDHLVDHLALYNSGGVRIDTFFVATKLLSLAKEYGSPT
jgi:hypothetical protein